MGAPYFDGRNISEFLENLQYLYEEAGITTDSAKVQRLARYCGIQVSPWVKRLVEYRAGNWEGLKAVLLRQFRGRDDVQIQESPGFLDMLRRVVRIEEDDLSSYCYQFRGASSKLVDDKQITSIQECK